MSEIASSLASSLALEETKVSKESRTVQYQVILDNNIFHRKNVTAPGGTIVPVELLDAIRNCEQLKRLILPALIIETCGTSFDGIDKDKSKGKDKDKAIFMDPEKTHMKKAMDLCKYSLLGGSNPIFNSNIAQLSKVITGKDVAATNIKLDHLAMLVDAVTLDDVNGTRAVGSKINKQQFQKHKDSLVSDHYTMGKLNSGDLLYLLAASIYNVPLITANIAMVLQLAENKKKNCIIGYIFAHANIIVPQTTTDKAFNSGKDVYITEALKGKDGILAKVMEHYQFKSLGDGAILKTRCHSLKLMELCGLFRQSVTGYLDVPCVRVTPSAGKLIFSAASGSGIETKEKKEAAELKKALDVPVISPSKEEEEDDDYLAATVGAEPIIDTLPIKGSKNFGVFMCFDLHNISGPSCTKPVDCVPLVPPLRRTVSASA